ncbi:MAG: hypothetical protein ABIR80_03475 [Opitutaceae bacterium]
MKTLLAIFVTCLVLGRLRAEERANDSVAAHRDFLLGMNFDSGLVVGPGGSEGFWPTEAAVADLYERIAKLYARDIGVDPKMIATGQWKPVVAASLRTEKEVDPMVFLAGAYARWGTPTGFRVSGSTKGYAIARLVSDLNRFNVQLVHVAGYPGGTTVTVSDGGESESREFFDLMKEIKIRITKENSFRFEVRQ